jgi:tetratricopeptide (TPR) repeat protein
LAFDKAEKAYQSAIDNAPENYEANYACGLFSQQLHRFENARTAYQRCLGWARKAGKNSEVASTLNNLGNLDRDQGHVEEARKEYAEALQIRRELAQKDPETYRSDVADTLTNLGFLDSDQGHVEEARKECIEALQIYEELANKNAERYSVDVVRVKKRVEDLPK